MTPDPSTSIQTPHAPAAIGPYAQGRTGPLAGRWLVSSGQVGLDPASGQLVPGGIQAETRQTMEIIKAGFARYGVGMDRVVKCTVFLADMKEWAAMNEVYVTYFPAGKMPARSALGASGLALGARVEIECIAAL